MKKIYFDDDPLWYKDAIIYELHVRAFYDSNEDGVGDFRGLTEKLNYLESLGVTAIWLLPFYPSPLKDDGYDIADYFNVHNDYGSLKNFKDFLKAAHHRGIRVITELVLNHTSSEHIWFQQSRQAKPGSKMKDFYVWSDTPNRYRDARIIFKDFETSNWTWDATAGAYYWHRFYSHQPDLNFENPNVQKAMLKAIDFWLDLGVDGLRLDAVPYLYEQEGTNCENLPETHTFLKKLRTHVDNKFKNKMLLAEANQWPEDAAAYFGKGDECHMAFHFPVMPRMFMAIQMEDSFPIVDIFRATPNIPASCQWATFLRNHDELTLEMVTDEERDYMYRVYAKNPRSKINLGIRRRLSPLLNNNRKKIELMNILLFSLPGTPVLYYGDEIGMGDNYYLGDRNGVRTPMQWSPDKNAGFSRANPHQIYLPAIIDPEYHYEAINVENQESNLSSLLWWMKRVITMRKKFKSFSRGDLTVLFPNNAKVLAFIRQYQNEIMLVVVNLSRFSQAVELDLSKYAGLIPEEVFSQNKFPTIGKRPYVLTLVPFSHFWLILQENKKKSIIMKEENMVPELTIKGDWENILTGKQKEMIEEKALPKYIKRCRWFGAKTKTIRTIEIVENTPVNNNSSSTYLTLIKISYSEGAPDLYLLPLSFALKSQSHRIIEDFPQSVIAHLHLANEEGILYDALYDDELHKILLTSIARRRKIKGLKGEFITSSGKNFKALLGEKELPLTSHLLRNEQSNTSIIYENNFILKLYRRIDEGINPDLEINRLLTERSLFSHIPAYSGSIEYKQKTGETFTIALLQDFVNNEGDAWIYTKDEVSRYFERVLSKKGEIKGLIHDHSSFLDTNVSDIPPLMQDLIGGVYLESAHLLGKRTAELHLTLGSITGEEAFSPESFSTLYQRSLYQSMQSLLRRTCQSLEFNIKKVPLNIRKEAQKILDFEQNILTRMQKIMAGKISAMKIRIHGDYHLGQVLYTGKDFVIIDFEGEPTRTLSERRLKHSVFKDVAGMIRSFHYAAYVTLLKHASVRPKDADFLEQWIQPWYHYISKTFLHSYLNTMGNSPLVPKEKESLEILLEAFLLEKAVYELNYELNHRPSWIIIPIRGINHLLSNT